MSSRRGSRNGNRSGGRYGGKNRGGGRGNGCHNCGGVGHYARDCPELGGSGGRRMERNPERQFFDKMTKNGNATIQNELQATRFLKASLVFAEVDGASALLYRLSDPELSGLSALTKALEYMTDRSAFVDGYLPLVELLGREELNKPVYAAPLKAVLTHMYKMPFLVPCIAQHYQDGYICNNSQRTALIWFFTMVCLEHEFARNSPAIRELAGFLGEFGGAESLKTILGGSALADRTGIATSLADVRLSQSEVPGGRHDNDKRDFRSIAIVPTLEEFLCEADPYLPKIHDSVEPMTEAQLLDRHFRLLREDVIGPSKDQQDDPRKEYRDVIYGVKPKRAETGAPVYRGNSKDILIRSTDPCICYEFKLPACVRNYKSKGTREKEEFWTKTKRLVPRDALVCLQRKDRDGEWVPVRFATIARREPKELSKPEPIIGLRFLSKNDTMEALKELSHRTAPTRMVVVSAELFAYEPILRALKMMPGVPFADEVLHGTQVKLPKEEQGYTLADVGQSVAAKVETLDAAQKSALDSALSNRMALIQGPPGTGKTYIGVILAQILLATTTEKILCVTYTNHALDDFLEDLLDAGITDIVRLGGRSRSDRLAEYNLREQASSGKTPFSRDQTRRYAQLKGTIEDAEQQVKRLQKALQREIGEKWWRTVGDFLHQNDQESWKQLHLKPSDLKDEDGYTVQGINGEDHLWKCWLKGKDPPSFLRGRFHGPLWSLSKDERAKQKLEWQHEMYEPERSAMEAALRTIQTANEELKQLKQLKDATVLGSRRVIGCTTTKAAMCKNLLDGLSAGIVLVEEAAEILEAHVITSLSAGTKRVIMIGDHKQLRPKCQHYPLTVESGRDFGLNTSLFERLAGVMPVSTLRAQHRMHPEISAIPRLVTYNDLEDAEAVHKHAVPLGMASRVVFLHHEREEDREMDADNIVDSVSRTNTYEVEMVVGVVRYLFQQGYKPDDMVVLTPYLGQMVKVQKALSAEFDVHVDDRDMAEAREANLELVKKAPPVREDRSSVRVATIDNYQGEEAKIVVASLVRSNQRGEIGFLKEAERVNVMLSRARDCEIILGNKETFERARGSHEPLRGGPLWKTILTLLDSKGCVLPGLPVKCVQHGTANFIRDPTDFTKLCPDGGCNTICDKQLDCGHPCKKRCHVGPCQDCQIICPDTCPRGHPILRVCSQRAPKCKVSIAWKCPLGHRSSGPCHAGMFQAQCTSCLKMKHDSAATKEKEQQMQRLLDTRYAELAKAKHALLSARQAKQDRQELTRIEQELAMATQALEETLQTEVSRELAAPEARSVQEDRNHTSDAGTELCEEEKFNAKVGALLKTSHPNGLEPNELLRRYQDRFGTDLKSDAKRARAGTQPQSPKGNKRQKLKDILASLSCCEIVMEPSSPTGPAQSKMLVRLREEPVNAEDSLPLPSGIVPSPKRPRVNLELAGAVSEKEGVGVDDSIDRTHVENAPTESHQRRASTESSDDPQTATTKSLEEAKRAHIDDNSPATRMQKNQMPIPSNTKEVPIEEIGANEAENCTGWNEVAVLEIVRRYKSNGALRADMLLDQHLEDSPQRSDGLLALRLILHDELDPGGAAVDEPPPPKKAHPVLTRALCSLSAAIYYSADFPLQAKGHAGIFLKYVEEGGVALPESWLERSKVMIQQLTREMTTSVASGVQTESLDDEWSGVLGRDSKAPEVMRASILPMIGLREVKRSFIKMYHRARLAIDQDDGAAASYNARFEGNPGTGKTTIARHYGKFLRQLGVLGKDTLFREISGAKLIYDGIKGLKDLLEEMQEHGGGVIFVDEAYQLKSDREGKKALDFILPLAEKLHTEYGSLVWILAGYKKPMELLFEHNEGLPSRFPFRFIFADYSDKELGQIFRDMMVYKDGSSQQANNLQQATKPNPAARRFPSGFSKYSRSYNVGSTMEGRCGGSWTYKDGMGWTDKYGNVAVDPKKVGTAGHELVTSSGATWTEKNGLWTNQSGAKQSHYPGSPPPVRTREKRPQPFCVKDEKDIRIAIRRLGRRRGESAFGNTRAVRNLFEQVRDRQAERIEKERKQGRAPCVFTLTATDLIGQKITTNTLEECSAWKELKAKEGLFPVKEAIKQMFNLVLKNNIREEREEKPFELVLNRLFIGNPGTGKTTVAEMYARILADIGLLSKGEVIMKCASDFLGDHLGQSEKQTQNILRSAEGCVLVIDEAYSLYSGKGLNDPYKTAVIDTIVEKVQAKPGADIAVIMLGYKEEMEEMMRNVNPGLSRRFQVENAFVFPDFSDESLLRIMMAKARSKEVRLAFRVAKRAVSILAKARAKPHFGNAGAIENMLSEAIVKMQGRTDATELTEDDFGYKGDVPDSDVLDSLFDEFVGSGCKEIKETMDTLRATVEFSVAKGNQPSSGISFSWLFLGNPGTGKTTVARKMGQMFHALGLLATDEIQEAKASDLITGYTGQAGKQTRELMRKSLGGVLFIDEAYQLDPNRGGHYMSEVVDELVGCLTEVEFKDKILVILAGYDEPMEQMLATNPGMQSRFQKRVHFHDFDAATTAELLVSELKKRDIGLREGEDEIVLLKLAQELVSSKDFGNGRDVVSWADRTYQMVAARCSRGKRASRVETMAALLEDVERALDEMLQSRQVRLGGAQCQGATRDGREHEQGQDATMKPPRPPATQLLVEQKMDDAPAQEESPLSEDDTPEENLFAGINVAVLSTLQKVVEEEGLSSEEGSRRLAQLDPKSQEFANLVSRLVSELSMSPAEAEAQLLDWQSKQKDLDEMLQKQAHKQKTLGVRPIWRCGVCGRADKPWIACYVAPFIVRYEKVPLS